MDYEIEKALSELEEVFESIGRGLTTEQDVCKHQELLCLWSRALYSRYVDAVLWRGAIDARTRRSVHDALERAYNQFPGQPDEQAEYTSSAAKKAVYKRLQDFIHFSEEKQEPAGSITDRI